MATPLSRYYPDFPLAMIEAKDLQTAVKATGSFGEETQKLLGVVLNDALSSEIGAGTPPALRDLTVRTMIASIQDLTVAGYTVRNNPELLMSIRLTKGNGITTTLQTLFNEAMKEARPAQRIREGNYLAVADSGFNAGMGNNIFYLSTNADLLRSYLRRLNGQNLPVAVNNPAYRTALEGTGDGFFKQMVNLSSVSQLLARDNTIPKKFINVLRTLNLTASASSIVNDGMETKSLTQLNPNGGDAALLKLLTYTPEKLSLLSELPSTLPNAAVIATDTAGWLDYIGNWLPDLEFSAAEQKDLLAAFGRLKDRLGGEWAVASSNTIDTSVLSTALSLTGGLGGLESLVSPNSSTVFYGKVKDGALALNDLETAIRTELNIPASTTPATPTTPATTTPATPAPASQDTLERIKIGGFEALLLKNNNPPSEDGTTREEQIIIVNKNNTLVISANRNLLESTLAAAPLLDNPLFKAIPFPTRTIGVQFAAPIRLSRAEIDAGVKSLVNFFGTVESDVEIPANLVTAVGDYLESWSSRTQTSYGYLVADGNKLRGYSKSGFSWNK